MNRLHYFYDAQCGWCYAVAPLIWEAAQLPGVTVELHGGGLWPKPTVLPAAMRERIRSIDGRISQMSGQPFGSGYLDKLLPSETMWLDSSPTTAAILAAGKLRKGADLLLLRALQKAHYETGEHVTESETLLRLASDLGFDSATFSAVMSAAKPDAHIAQSQAMMNQLGLQGFPATVVETASSYTAIAPQDWFMRPKGYVAAIQAALGERMH